MRSCRKIEGKTVVQPSRSKRARRNSSPRMIKVTVHEKRRVNEEQPTPASSPSRNHDNAEPRQHPLICTGAEQIHQVHGPPKPRATWQCLEIGFIFLPFSRRFLYILIFRKETYDSRYVRFYHRERPTFCTYYISFGCGERPSTRIVKQYTFLKRDHDLVLRRSFSPEGLTTEFTMSPWRRDTDNWKSPVHESGVFYTEVVQWGTTSVHTEVEQKYTEGAARGTPVYFRGFKPRKWFEKTPNGSPA